MIKVANFQMPFDPISEKELKFAKKLIKDNHLDYLFFVVDEEGILPKDQRIKLLEKALSPYKKMVVGQCQAKTYSLDDIDEEVIRKGQFVKACPGIRGELVSKQYYIDEIVKSNCNQHRTAHSYEVAKLCVQLAKAHGVDTNLAYLTGLLHDITKAQPDEWHQRIMEIYCPENLEYSPPVWHSFTAPWWIKTNMGINDPVMLNAIYEHTLGRGQSKLAKILFIADKCEPTRGYDTSKQIGLSMQNLNEGFKLVKHEQEEYLKKENGNG